MHLHIKDPQPQIHTTTKMTFCSVQISFPQRALHAAKLKAVENHRFWQRALHAAEDGFRGVQKNAAEDGFLVVQKHAAEDDICGVQTHAAENGFCDVQKHAVKNIFRGVNDARRRKLSGLKKN